MGVEDCMRLKLLILRWIDDCGDGDGDDGNNPPVLSRLQFLKGPSKGGGLGIDEGEFRYEKELMKGERERKKSTRHTLAR